MDVRILNIANRTNAKSHFSGHNVKNRPVTDPVLLPPLRAKYIWESDREKIPSSFLSVAQLAIEDKCQLHLCNSMPMLSSSITRYASGRETSRRLRKKLASFRM